MVDRIQVLLELILREMVDSPEELTIKRFEDETKIVYFVFTKKGEEGLIIGKGGTLANSVREIIKVVSRKLLGKPVYLDIVRTTRKGEAF